MDELDALLIERCRLLKELRNIDEKIGKVKKNIYSPSRHERNLVKLKYVRLLLLKQVEYQREPWISSTVVVAGENKVYTAVDFYSESYFLPLLRNSKTTTYIDFILRKDIIYFNSGYYHDYKQFLYRKYTPDLPSYPVVKFRLNIIKEKLEKLVQAFRRNWAARRIQSYVRNVWFERPTYTSGHVGYHARKTWELIEQGK
jgi:hypothetical protein